ncbi:MAG TPA: ferredoxin family protein [Candidatus Thermoplasmatota archaeon]|nr:ferredoxin family protein [Candidatus Thermoplasmatota archaeon]
MTRIVCEPCVNVKSGECIDVCPVDCFYDHGDQVFIAPEECIDCGACESVCPVTAIFPEEEVPEQMKEFTQRNYAWTAEKSYPNAKDKDAVRAKGWTPAGEMAAKSR